jgi:hypothetical protein
MLRIVLLSAVLLGAGIGGYVLYADFTTLSIDELLADASRLEGKRVTVQGNVDNNAGIYGVGGYLLSDGQDSVVVISSSGVPAYGTTVTVTGVFHRAFTLGPLEASVIHQE